ncbi:Glucan endo-1,3-beta-glucosidase A1 [Paramyrothecium foliicola]|nr:Glucan endo-1,3-beta-glucosidase A1 [Paramyrothecium foliicola]
MGWRDHLKRVKQEFDQLVAEPDKSSSQGQAQGYPGNQGYQQPPPQQWQQPQPPPVQYASRPPQRYWQPRCQPDVPVTADWDAKLGNGPDGWGNQELQHYTADPSNVFHTPNGQLVLRAVADHNAPTPDKRFTSARLVSRATLARDRGILSAVILSPCAEGIWPAFWLLPQEPFSWPTDGEVDIAETWNGDHENRTCLHWGFHHEPHKHRVLGTKIPDMHARPVQYDFAWEQPNGQPGQGRMVWYIDGRPVMKGRIPEGTRPMRDMTILLNVAMGGNVCGGKTPANGYYDMVIYSLFMADEPEYGGWGRFEGDWNNPGIPEGNTY